MNRKQKYVLVILSLGMALVLVSLFLLSSLSREILPSSFKRKFISSDSIHLTHSAYIEVNSFYIAGVTSDEVYLGNSTAPFHVLSLDHQLKTPTHQDIQVNLDSVKNLLTFELRVDSPYFFLMHGIEPIIMRGKLGEWEANRIFNDDDYFFNDAVPIGAKSFVLKSYNAKSECFELAKKTEHEFIWNKDLIDRQIDGIFDVDGRIHFDRKENILVYTHFYKNVIVVSDSSLKKKVIMHTLDTFSIPRLKIAKLNDGTESMPAVPPFLISGITSLYNGKLVMKSNLLATNQSVESFLNGSTFDVYDVKKGNYMTSFVLPDFKGYKVKNIKLYKERLFAIYDRYVVTYKILI